MSGPSQLCWRASLVEREGKYARQGECSKGTNVVDTDEPQNGIPFEDDGDDTQSQEIAPENRILRTQAYDKSVGDLVAMVKSEDIILDPDYQRNYIWDNRKSSLLVESFLLNVPIPIIYVSEETDGRWSVVDGLQRLTSLRRFFDDEFKLSKLEVFQELNGLSFSKLPPKSQRNLKNGILRIIVILQESHPEIKYDIFQRLNRGSIRLNEQELRNCLYRGALTNALRSTRTNKLFLEVIGLKEPHPRFYDAELILRCLAMGEAFDPSTGTVVGYPNKMKSFLNDYMEVHKRMDESAVAKKMEKVLEVFGDVHAVFGVPAFRRPIPGTSYTDSRLNRALMDSVVATFWNMSSNKTRTKAVEIKALLEQLVGQDSVFADSLIYGTSDKKKVEYRIKTFFNAVTSIVI